MVDSTSSEQLEQKEQDDGSDSNEWNMPIVPSDSSTFLEILSRELAKEKESIQRWLCGYRYDYIDNRWIIEEDSRRVSNEGVGEVLSIVDRHTSGIMSNLNKNQVPVIMNMMAKELMIFLKLKGKKYKIKVEDNVVIFNEILTRCFYCLQRGLDEGERRLLKTTYQAKEIFSQTSGNSGQEGMWSRINPFRKK